MTCRLLFWIIAGLTGASAVMVVVTQNIVRAAAWLLFTLVGTSASTSCSAPTSSARRSSSSTSAARWCWSSSASCSRPRGRSSRMRTGAGEWAGATRRRLAVSRRCSPRPRLSVANEPPGRTTQTSRTAQHRRRSWATDATPPTSHGIPAKAMPGEPTRRDAGNARTDPTSNARRGAAGLRCASRSLTCCRSKSSPFTCWSC